VSFKYLRTLHFLAHTLTSLFNSLAGASRAVAKMSITTSPISDSLETPTLDAESPTLLHSISSHGGYAYVRMSSLAAAGDIRAAEAVREMAWEQLHSGPWHSVLPVWRDAYSMACLQVAKCCYENGEFKEALRALDMGIIMGGSLLRKDLDSAVVKVSEKARLVKVDYGRCKDFEGSEHQLVDLEFDVSKVRFLRFFFEFNNVLSRNRPNRKTQLLYSLVDMTTYDYV